MKNKYHLVRELNAKTGNFFSCAMVVLFFVAILQPAVKLSAQSAQSASAHETENRLRKAAAKYFDQGDFIEAYPLYSQLLSLYPRDPNYNYRFGACMLFTKADKNKAVEYLEYSVKQTNVDDLAFYYLGRAFHLDYKFNEAVRYYKKYEQTASSSDLKKYPVRHLIEMCANGKALLTELHGLDVLRKKELNLSDYFEAYDMHTNGGTLLAEPDGFKTKLDKEKNVNNVIYLTPNKKQAYFSSYGNNEKNGKDIYMVKRNPDGSWGTPENLGDIINSAFDEDYPVYDVTKHTLYFCSKGHNSMGGYDIFMSVYNESTNSWGAPVNLDFPVNSPDDDILFVPDTSGETAFFSSTRSSPQGTIDVYKIAIHLHPPASMVIAGTAYMDDGKTPTLCKITVKDIKKDTIVGIYMSSSEDGKYSFNLPNGGSYNYTVEASNHKVQSQSVVLPVSQTVSAMKQDIKFDPSGNLQINSYSVDMPKDSDYQLAFNYIKEQAQMNVNVDTNSIEALLAKSNAVAANSSAPVASANTSGNNSQHGGNASSNNANNASGNAAASSNSADGRLDPAVIAQLEKEAEGLNDKASKAIDYASDKMEDALQMQMNAEMVLDNQNQNNPAAQNPDSIAAAKKEMQQSVVAEQKGIAAYQLAAEYKNEAALKQQEAEKGVHIGSAGDSTQGNNTATTNGGIGISAAMISPGDLIKRQAEEVKEDSFQVAKANDDLAQDISGLQQKSQDFVAQAGQTTDADQKTALLQQADDLAKSKKEKQEVITENNAELNQLHKEYVWLNNRARKADSAFIASANSGSKGTIATPASEGALQQEINDYAQANNYGADSAGRGTEDNSDNKIANNDNKYTSKTGTRNNPKYHHKKNTHTNSQSDNISASGGAPGSGDNQNGLNNAAGNTNFGGNQNSQVANNNNGGNRASVNGGNGTSSVNAQGNNGNNGSNQNSQTANNNNGVSISNVGGGNGTSSVNAQGNNGNNGSNQNSQAANNNNGGSVSNAVGGNGTSSVNTLGNNGNNGSNQNSQAADNNNGGSVSSVGGWNGTSSVNAQGNNSNNGSNQNSQVTNNNNGGSVSNAGGGNGAVSDNTQGNNGNNGNNQNSQVANNNNGGSVSNVGGSNGTSSVNTQGNNSNNGSNQNLQAANNNNGGSVSNAGGGNVTSSVNAQGNNSNDGSNRNSQVADNNNGGSVSNVGGSNGTSSGSSQGNNSNNGSNQNSQAADNNNGGSVSSVGGSNGTSSGSSQGNNGINGSNQNSQAANNNNGGSVSNAGGSNGTSSSSSQENNSNNGSNQNSQTADNNNGGSVSNIGGSTGTSSSSSQENNSINGSNQNSQTADNNNGGSVSSAGGSNVAVSGNSQGNSNRGNSQNNSQVANNNGASTSVNNTMSGTSQQNNAIILTNQGSQTSSNVNSSTATTIGANNNSATSNINGNTSANNSGKMANTGKKGSRNTSYSTNSSGNNSGNVTNKASGNAVASVNNNGANNSSVPNPSVSNTVADAKEGSNISSGNNPGVGTNVNDTGSAVASADTGLKAKQGKMSAVFGYKKFSAKNDVLLDSLANSVPKQKASDSRSSKHSKNLDNSIISNIQYTDTNAANLNQKSQNYFMAASLMVENAEKTRSKAQTEKDKKRSEALYHRADSLDDLIFQLNLKGDEVLAEANYRQYYTNANQIATIDVHPSKKLAYKITAAKRLIHDADNSYRRSMSEKDRANASRILATKHTYIKSARQDLATAILRQQSAVYLYFQVDSDQTASTMGRATSDSSLHFTYSGFMKVKAKEVNSANPSTVYSGGSVITNNHSENAGNSNSVANNPLPKPAEPNPVRQPMAQTPPDTISTTPVVSGKKRPTKKPPHPKTENNAPAVVKAANNENNNPAPPTNPGNAAYNPVAETQKHPIIPDPGDIFKQLKHSPYSASHPIPIDPQLPMGLIFKIQIGAFKNPIKQNLFKGFEPIIGLTAPQGYVRYSAGLFRTIDPARVALAKIKDLGYPDAFIIAFYDGRRISIQEAMEKMGTPLPPPAATTVSAQPNSNIDSLAFARLQAEAAEKEKLKTEKSEKRKHKKKQDDNANPTQDNTASNNVQATANVTSSGNNKLVVIGKNTIKPTKKSIIDERKKSVKDTVPPKSKPIRNVKGLVYTVQVGSFPRHKDFVRLSKMKKLYSSIDETGAIKYNCGTYSSIADARAAKDIIMANTSVKDAFVSAYYNGKRISLTKAADLLSKGVETGPSQPVDFSTNNTDSQAPAAKNTPSVAAVQAPASQPAPTANTTAPAESKKPAGEDIVSKSFEDASKEHVIFTVQIGSYAGQVPVEDANRILAHASDGIEPHQEKHGVVAYYAGKFTDLDSANALQQKMNEEGFRQAFIVAYYHGKKISLQEAQSINNK